MKHRPEEEVVIVRGKISGGTTSSSPKRPKRRLKRWVKRFLSLTLLCAMSYGIYYGWRKVEEYIQWQIELKEQQRTPIHQAQLVIGESGVEFSFFIEQGEEPDIQLVSQRIPVEQLRFESRRQVPYPYLQTTCAESQESCDFQTAQHVVFYLELEDITLAWSTEERVFSIPFELVTHEVTE